MVERYGGRFSAKTSNFIDMHKQADELDTGSEHRPAGCSHTVMRRLSDNEIVTVARLNHQHLANRENIIDVMRLLANFSPSIDRIHVTSQGVHYYQWGEAWLVKHGECLILSGDDVTHIRDAGHVSRNYSKELHYVGQL